jgi:8-oxo-dGTP pyrophosphatase MutT (NUDIX family)
LTPSDIRFRLHGLTGPETADDTTDLRHPEFGDAPPVRAAVLVPIVFGRQPGVLLTKRSAHLAKHGGQIAFPGGRIDPEDASPEAAALREAHEEIGLVSSHVELLGRLGDHLTGTNYAITPVVGLLPHGLDLADLDLVASPHEVAAMFLLPLEVLLDPAAPTRKSGHWRGRDRDYWQWPHDEHQIWGATAAILVGLAAALRGES